eukprot:scaffold11440_cov136-Isochrysis_galbana.AAC.2
MRGTPTASMWPSVNLCSGVACCSWVRPERNFGMSSTCVGATGAMSRKASTCAGRRGERRSGPRQPAPKQGRQPRRAVRMGTAADAARALAHGRWRAAPAFARARLRTRRPPGSAWPRSCRTASAARDRGARRRRSSPTGHFRPTHPRRP